MPFVGLLYGIVAGSLLLLIGLLDPLVSAVITLFAIHGLNRFLHFDGLIDLGDGLIATGPHEKRMAAMKDTRVGAGGVGFGLLFSILLIAALAFVVTGAPSAAMVFFLPLAMEVLAKNSMITAAAVGRPREGMGSPFVSNTPPGHALLSAILSFVILLPVLTYLTAWEPCMALFVALLVLASSVTGIVVAAQAKKSFGYVNGDVLGATNELAKPVVLLIGMVGVLLYLSMFS